MTDTQTWDDKASVYADKTVGELKKAIKTLPPFDQYIITQTMRVALAMGYHAGVVAGMEYAVSRLSTHDSATVEETH